MRKSVVLFLIVLIPCAPFAVAQQQDRQSYPVRAVRFVVPFTVGGSADNYARIIAHRLSDAWGQQVIVENKAGSNGIVGTEFVAKSAADGYTLLLGTGGNIATNPALYRKLPYKPSDLSPVTLIATSQFVMLVSSAVAVTTVPELLALAKAKPGQLNYVSSGNGSPGHLAAELLAVMTGIKIVHVPYRAHGTMMADIAVGRAHLWFNGMAPAQAQIRVGKVRALAVTGASRARAMPSVPTVAEAGVPGYEVIGWYGIFVPVGTASSITLKMSTDVSKILRQPDVQERLAVDGADLAGHDPKQFVGFVISEMEKWEQLVKTTAITAD